MHLFSTNMIDTSPRTPLLVFAVGGRLGSGCSFVRDWLIHSLASFGYETEIIDVTKVFLKEIGSFISPQRNHEGASTLLDRPLTENASRVREMQERGNELRRRLGNEIIAALCVNEVIRPHIEHNDIIGGKKRQAYIIDSLKHPDEVRFFRKVFREAFYMVGVVASDSVRMKRLSERKGFDEDVFRFLSDIDADEQMAYGQRAIEVVTEADYFFANDNATKAQIQTEADRFLRLVFGVQVVSPRRDEVGMQAAIKAAKRSACLSRQVGAAIFDARGSILSTGHNDVPQFGGGLYGPESASDERCYARGGKCYNDEEKNLIVTELVTSLMQSGLIKTEISKDVIVKEIRKSRIKNLIEFSRAVHAEMHAIVSIARGAKSGLVGSTLYCTTYPCHNCAKHIIDAGIRRVVYLEPYEKSLARKLHADAINAPDEEPHQNKLSFDLYGGISPYRFEEFFRSQTPRKEDGRFLDRDRSRGSLTPLSAQESEVLMGRIQNVGEKIGKLVDRENDSDGSESDLLSTQEPEVITGQTPDKEV